MSGLKLLGADVLCCYVAGAMVMTLSLILFKISFHDRFLAYVVLLLSLFFVHCCQILFSFCSDLDRNKMYEFASSVVLP